MRHPRFTRSLPILEDEISVIRRREHPRPTQWARFGKTLTTLAHPDARGRPLIPHRTCSTYEKLGYDRAALDRLKNDQKVRQLLRSIREIWKALSGVVGDKKGSRWSIYFRLEREVIDVAHEHLRESDNAFFSEHDGWRCACPVDTAALEKLVFERTGYTLKFDKQSTVS